MIDFAEEIGWPLDPWEQAAVIRGGELLPDGRPRFRFVLVIVARQNGKTLLCRVLILYWMFIENHAEILGTSTSRETAKLSWREVVTMAEGIDLLADELDARHTREQIGEEAFWNVHGSYYRFAAPNRRAGRGSTLRRLILDELREHRNRDTYDAAVNAGNAVADFQAWAITNQGDSTSVVLDEVRNAALEYLETGHGDSRLGLLEWSAPNGADPTDPAALAMANPNLGLRVEIDALMGQAIQAKRAGGETLARFRTEIMCQRVTLLDPAIDPDIWADCGVDPADAVRLADHRRRVALCLDVSLDGQHATLVGAVQLDDGLVHVEVIRRWTGFGCTRSLRADLPDLVTTIRPRALGWFPAGPAAAVAVDLKKRGRAWPPRGVRVEELTADTTAVCMGLAEFVEAQRGVQHPRDPMLTQHVEQTQKLRRGDAWSFTRSGTGPVDGTYALAGAVHLARTVPAPLRPVTTG